MLGIMGGCLMYVVGAFGLVWIGWGKGWYGDWFGLVKDTDTHTHTHTHKKVKPRTHACYGAYKPPKTPKPR